MSEIGMYDIPTCQKSELLCVQFSDTEVSKIQTSVKISDMIQKCLKSEQKNLNLSQCLKN